MRTFNLGFVTISFPCDHVWRDTAEIAHMGQADRVGISQRCKCGARRLVVFEHGEGWEPKPFGSLGPGVPPRCPPLPTQGRPW